MADGVKVVRDAYAAFARGDVAAILGSLADDIDWNVPLVLPHGGHFTGSTHVAQFFAGIAERWENLSLDLDDFIPAGDHVIAVGRARGRLRGIGEASYGFAHLFTIRDGRFTRFREFVDPDVTLVAHGVEAR